MEFSSTEPRLSSYLHARACRSGTPLAGNFELTARCNFNCKMCYVHLTAEEQQRRGRELTADEWLAIAQEARSRGMLFLLLTGGEPLIRKDFRYLLTELKKMGMLVSVNSNGSLIDRDWLDFSGTIRRSASTSPSTGPAMPPMSGCAAVPCLPGSRRISGPCGSWAWG